MPTTSTIPAFRSALVAELVGSAGLSGVLVTYADPVEQAPEEVVHLGATTQGDFEEQTFKSGRRTRFEDYETEIIIRTAQRSSAENCEARAGVLLAAVENVLAADPASNPIITTTGVISAWPTNLDMRTTQSQEGPMTSIRLTVRTQARLT